MPPPGAVFRLPRTRMQDASHTARNCVMTPAGAIHIAARQISALIYALVRSAMDPAAESLFRLQRLRSPRDKSELVCVCFAFAPLGDRQRRSSCAQTRRRRPISSLKERRAIIHSLHTSKSSVIMTWTAVSRLSTIPPLAGLPPVLYKTVHSVVQKFDPRLLVQTSQR
jgi:hypothetical protein